MTTTIKQKSAALYRELFATDPIRNITPETLLNATRLAGLTALGIAPRRGERCKILLGSLGLDVADPAVQARLTELNRDREILIDRVDYPEAFVPKDRLAVWESGRFWHVCCWFDCLVLDGSLLVGSEVR